MGRQHTLLDELIRRARVAREEEVTVSSDVMPILSKGDMLQRALSAQTAFNKATGQNSKWTHKRAELAGYWFNLEAIEGPTDYGNGPALTLVMTDNDGVQYVCPASCSTGQWVGLATQEVIDYVNAGTRPLIRWDKAQSAKGADYYAIAMEWTPSEEQRRELVPGDRS